MRAKSEFLSNMSHELRTPLNAIIGYSEILIEEITPDDQQFADLQAINGAGQNLLRMINELLDLSKLEAGKMELFLEPFALRGFVDQIGRDWERTLAESGNALKVDCAANLGEVVGDSSKLAQAVGSLLSNAAKYTKNGQVTLAVAHRDGRIRIMVRDTGPGMSPEQMANLFEAFGKQEGETSSIYRETPGIGLPLSQRLCRLMGGNLTVDSAPGRGACFTIDVPSHPARQGGAKAEEAGEPGSGQALGLA